MGFSVLLMTEEAGKRSMMIPSSLEILTVLTGIAAFLADTILLQALLG